MTRQNAELLARLNPELLFPQPAPNLLPLVDLATAPFWIVALAAALLLPTITDGALRKAVFAFLNLAFLGLLHAPALPAVLVCLCLVQLGLRAIATAGRGPAPLLLGGVATLALFLVHKRPDWFHPGGLTALNPALAAVAFSYVTLRLIEVSRAVWEQRQPAPGPADLINYLLPFHMIAAGPIESYDAYASEPEVPPTPGTEVVLSGFERLSTGLFKKYVLAQALASVFLTGFRNPEPLALLLEIQVYYLWVYLDFSGYADVAVGVGRLIGIKTPENFDHPLTARNIFDFWGRWHMTLSRFIRVNIFVPTQIWLLRKDGGERPLRAALASWSLSFLLCGVWHAITLPYFLWGLYHGTGLVVCKLYETALLKRQGRKGYKRYLSNRPIRLLATALTFEFVAFSLAMTVIPWTWMWSQWTSR